MVTMGIFPFQGKTHMVEPGIEPGTSWLVVRNSDHQATRLVIVAINMKPLKISLQASDMVGCENGIKRILSCI